jgi:bifunctional UDP-N-acetylglucosamine pyrophosphorylase / glucosamine-1-phosphate N-acetyltransferase
VQSPQLGTGHALLQAESALAGKSGTLLLLYADVPLLQPNTLTRLVDHHRAAKAAATVLTMELKEPYGYGRIVRDKKGQIARIVEERDASADHRKIREVNSGIYCFDLKPLFGALNQLATDNAQSEYYLTDLVSIYRQRRLRVETLRMDSPAELRGVNSRLDLAELGETLRARKNREVMLGGATLEDPATTYIDIDVAIGADTIVGPGVVLQGSTTIGEGCRIHAGCRLTNVTMGDRVTVLDHSVLADSRIGSGARVGPFSHIRPLSDVGEDAHVGNFVELKKTSMARGAKANHLAYLGDATIGAGANIGAGTITCNYDGVHKHPTVIEDGAFIGSDSQLIAPVRIGAGAYVAAGSSITKDVPADALAVARAHQHNRPGWAAARRAKRAKGQS